MRLFVQRFRSSYRNARQHGDRPLRALVHGVRFLSPLYAPWWKTRRQAVRRQRQEWIIQHTDDLKLAQESHADALERQGIHPDDDPAQWQTL